ncbi:transcriptional regulator BetI [Variovorax sp. PBS-H4]|uniref:TetR/AcrR family transcriptional regulator n=1 Tax=Variovorax sp. PBS-H4 TaxID=434008 RepID=UPI0013166D91|nr:TetR/AcrR family transcriptional regulator [Variovorax sp. PBS-H4]VTU24410.1 transcriptional regulator BetI [Variovorax sp. PBS-H4]
MTGRRAYSALDRQRIRQAFIDAGRRILVEEGAGAMSMRRIAAEAGYSPASIYQYFPDQRALLVAIREFDMNAATDAMEACARGTAEPARRVRQVFLTAARYWLAHPDHFDVLFAGSRERAVLCTPDGVPFGRSSSVLRSLALYTQVVEDFLDSLPCRPVDTVLAMDTLIATTHGVIAFPRLTSSMSWSATAAMVETAVNALVDHWIGAASEASKGKHRALFKRV